MTPSHPGRAPTGPGGDPPLTLTTPRPREAPVTVTDWQPPGDADAPPPDSAPPPPDDLARRREQRATRRGEDVPHDPYAEQCTLGAMLLDAHTRQDVLEAVSAPDFYRPQHEVVFDAIAHLHTTGAPIDPVTVGDELRRRQQITRIGGQAYLHDLIASVPVASNGTYYAGIVADLAVRRRLAEAGRKVEQIALTPGDTAPAELLDAALGEVGRISTLTALAGTTTALAGDTWEPVDLDPIIEGLLAGTLTGPKAEIITRRDGKALIYPAAVHSISGEPGSAKTWFGLVGAAQEITDGRPVLVIDFEDRPETFANRLLSLGVDPSLLLAHLRYVRPEAGMTDPQWARLAVRARDCRLVLIDGITEAMTMHGLSLMDNADAAKWLALIPNRLASLGCGVLQVDHVVKDSESRGRYSIGAQHKLAGITGTAYKALIVKSFGKGERGLTRIVVDKDKHGDVGATGMTIAELHLDATQSAADGATVSPIFGWLETPQESHDEDGNFRPTVLMKRVSEYLERSPGGSLRAIRMAVKGKGASIDIAVETLIREGYIRVEKGTRDASFHFLIRPFDDKE